MTWKRVADEWLYPYRVSDEGVVQKQQTNGKWRTIRGYMYSGLWKIRMKTKDGKTKSVPVSKLVADAFMGGTPPGMRRVHKNGMAQDNAVANLVFMTQSQLAKKCRRWNCYPVLKIDTDGNVVDIYRSASDAAMANYISKAALSRICRGEVKDPYHRYGYNFQYETRPYRRKKH